MKTAKCGLGMVFLLASLVSCRTAVPLKTGDEAARPPSGISVYIGELRAAERRFRQEGNLDGCLRCRAEIERVESEKTMPAKSDPALLELLKQVRAGNNSSAKQ
jgi:hypothetical protein